MMTNVATPPAPDWMLSPNIHLTNPEASLERS